jgi:alpha-1,6-mannosyltransferase
MDPHRRRATLATAAVLATAGVVAVVASRPASPFTPPLYPGARAFPPLVWLAGALGLDRLSRDAVGIIGAAALFASAAAFVFALVQAWRGALPTRRVVLVAVILHVLAVAIPLFLSRDVYSYAIYGRMVSHHGANPYTEIPAAFPTDATYPRVSVDWIDSPSVYGPAFTATAGGVTALVESPANIVTGFKVLAAVASLGTVLLVLAAARRLLPERAAFAAVLVGWNPVVVFHGVAGGHNDAILALAVAAAVLAIAARRELWGTAALALGTLVKVSGAIPLLVAVVAAVLRRPAGERWRAFWLHAGVAAAVSVPFVVPFMQTEDPTLGTLELTSRQGWLAPSRFVLTIVRGVARVVGGDVAYDVASLLVRVAFPLLFGWVLATLLRHLARDRLSLQPEVVLGAMGWASLISLLVSPVLLPWYAAWVLPLAWFLPNPARGGAVLVSVALTITELVAEPTRSPGVWEAMVFGLHWVATPIVLLVLIRLVLDLRRRAALVPAGGPSSPLVVERLDAESVGGRLPRRAVASSDQPGGHVSGTTDGDAERHRDRTIEREAESIGHERRRDAQGRSD